MRGVAVGNNGRMTVATDGYLPAALDRLHGCVAALVDPTTAAHAKRADKLGCRSTTCCCARCSASTHPEGVIDQERPRPNPKVAGAEVEAKRTL